MGQLFGHLKFDSGANTPPKLMPSGCRFTEKCVQLLYTTLCKEFSSWRGARPPPPGVPSTGPTSRASVLLCEPNPFCARDHQRTVFQPRPLHHPSHEINDGHEHDKAPRGQHQSSRPYPQGAFFACGNAPPTFRNHCSSKNHSHRLANETTYANLRASWAPLLIIDTTCRAGSS